jgi:hypothetical protein
MGYRIKVKAGKHIVIYDCPTCAAELEAPLEKRTSVPLPYLRPHVHDARPGGTGQLRIRREADAREAVKQDTARESRNSNVTRVKRPRRPSGFALTRTSSGQRSRGIEAAQRGLGPCIRRRHVPVGIGGLRAGRPSAAGAAMAGGDAP